MSESSNSGPLTSTPTFVDTRFSTPVWEVRVNGTKVADAILEKVDLGFGSDLSSASFILPRSPLSIDNPIEGDTVEVIVNSKLVFKGPIVVKNDHLGSSGLRIRYACSSNITKYNHKTVIKGAFNSTNSDYPNTLFNVFGIFNAIGVSATNVPHVYPGEVNITDQTLLGAMESTLAKVGNYKLDYDMAADVLDVYSPESGGTNTRSFVIGKNVINYDITKSSENIVGKVVIIGERSELTVQKPVGGTYGITQSGRRGIQFTLTGKNIRNIQIEGLTREQPVIQYDPNIAVNKDMLTDITQQVIFGKVDENDPTLDDANTTLKHIVIDGPHDYESEWTSISVETEEAGTDVVHVFVSELPKIWRAQMVKGLVDNTKAGIATSGTTKVEIVDKFVYTAGSLRATYTYDGNRPTATVGTGPIIRTITDTQYQIIQNTATGYNNSAFVLQTMAIRAQGEYNRTHLPEITGSITVLGDETVTLKHTLLLEGQLLDIVHITHDFSNGFTTTVSITNEQLRTNKIFYVVPRRTGETERDRRRTQNIHNANLDILKQKISKIKSEPKKPGDTGKLILCDTKITYGESKRALSNVPQ